MTNLDPDVAAIQNTIAYISDDHQDTIDAGLDALDRLSARLQEAEERNQQLVKDNANAWNEGWRAPQERLVAAEAREAALREALTRELGFMHGDDTIRRLRAALAIPEDAPRGYEVHIQTGATPQFAADEDAPKGEVLNPPANYSSQDQSWPQDAPKESGIDFSDYVEPRWGNS